jgi:hypothetical protein
VEDDGQGEEAHAPETRHGRLRVRMKGAWWFEACEYAPTTSKLSSRCFLNFAQHHQTKEGYPRRVEVKRVHVLAANLIADQRSSATLTSSCCCFDCLTVALPQKNVTGTAVRDDHRHEYMQTSGTSPSTLAPYANETNRRLPIHVSTCSLNCRRVAEHGIPSS